MGNKVIRNARKTPLRLAPLILAFPWIRFGPPYFPICTNDFPDGISSNVYLFANECVTNCEIARGGSSVVVEHRCWARGGGFDSRPQLSAPLEPVTIFSGDGPSPITINGPALSLKELFSLILRSIGLNATSSHFEMHAPCGTSNHEEITI